MFTFFEELAEPVKQVARTAWQSRGKLAHDVKSYTVLAAGTVYSMPHRAVKVIGNPKLQELIAEEEDPEALAAVVFGTGGALCLGSVGAVVGMALGGVGGTAVGAVPAIFTLGLSLPIGAVIGGAGGLAAGAVVGSSAGFAGGAASGGTVTYFRREIRQGVFTVYDTLVLQPVAAVKSTTKKARKKVCDSTEFTVDKAKQVSLAIKDAAAEPRVQVTAVSAGAGAAALGTAGAAAGAVAGSLGGALVGIVPAVFTFGLSIPVGAIVGGGAGLTVGGVAGTVMGFTSGGVAGFLGHKYRDGPIAVVKYGSQKAHQAAVAAHLVRPAAKLD